MSVLVFVEHHGNDLDRSALGVLAKAVAIGHGEVGAVLVGKDAGALAPQVGEAGAQRVYVVEGELFDAPLAQPRVDVIEEVVRSGGYDAVFFSNTVLTSDIAAGLSARLDAGLNWDLTDIAVANGQLVAKRPALSDSIVVDVAWRSPQKLALFRSGSFTDMPTTDGQCSIERPTVSLQPFSGASTVISQVSQVDEGPKLEDAEVIVSGGMGLGTKENFALADGLADALGGVVGATRAVVYAGWKPHAAQIGQTGKKVSPKLYVALGISGAVQHKVGMQHSKTIIAINKDPHAPIFEFSDLAVIGDVHTIVPQLTELIRKHKGS